jgi:alpha-1,3-glucan synthase
MNQYPGRVYAKPEFVGLPPFVFSGAEFALMPSRDEPFGLVAVEFGRKGALCIGSRVGGFGHMPGWWFTVESLTPMHLLSQFRSAVDAAMNSDNTTRALMRAYALQQRYPVAQWLSALDTLQSTAVQKSNHNRQVKTEANIGSMFGLQIDRTDSLVFNFLARSTRSPTPSGNTTKPRMVTSRTSSFGNLHQDSILNTPEGDSNSPGAEAISSTSDICSALDAADSPPLQLLELSGLPSDSSHSSLRVSTIFKSLEKSSSMANLTPTFTDSRNKYYDDFSKKLDEKENRIWNESIEVYIKESEKDWFRRFHLASLKTTTRKPDRRNSDSSWIEFSQLLGTEHKAPSAINKLLNMTIGSWNVYCYLLTLVSGFII